MLNKEIVLVVKLLSPKETLKKIDELSVDPMGSFVATFLLLAPEYKEIVREIRKKYELEYIPIEFEERSRYFHKVKSRFFCKFLPRLASFM